MIDEKFVYHFIQQIYQWVRCLGPLIDKCGYEEDLIDKCEYEEEISDAGDNDEPITDGIPSY